MAEELNLKIACERYVRFLLKSYLKWSSVHDLCDVSSKIRFNKPTIVRGKSYYPGDFESLIRTQILVSLEVEYQSTTCGWHPHVTVHVDDADNCLDLEIWFTRISKKTTKTAS